MTAITLSADKRDAIPRGPKRIVTLMASATEIVSALGCRDWIVGRSHECDYPGGLAAVPILTEPTFPDGGDGREIDGHVKTLVEQGMSVHHVFAERLKDLRPDVIITQDQCEVRAVSLPDVERAISDWTERDVRVVSCKPNRLGDVWDDIRRIADALDLPEAGDRLVFSMQARMNAIAARAASVAPRPRVLCVSWLDPLMSASGWIPDIVTLAGGVGVLAEPGQHARWITWDSVVAAEADVIVVMPSGFDIARAGGDMAVLEGKPGFSELKAVREGRVAVVDGGTFFHRPGPRLLESVEILAEILHPELFDFGHYSEGWVEWPGVSSFV